MRSSPLLLLLLVTLGFGVLAVPLTRLTTAKPATQTVRSPEAAGSPVSTLIRLRFAHQPVRVSLQQDGGVIAAMSEPAENPSELTAPLRLAGDAVELVIEARWPAGTPATAVTVELEPDGFEARSATRWTDTAGLTEVVSFSWR